MKSLAAFWFPCILIFTLSLTHCQSTEKKGDSASLPQAQESSSDLSAAEAQARRARLKDVHYKLAIVLENTTETFRGLSQIQFHLSDTARPLRVDFFEGEVKSLTVNGQSVPLEAKKKFWLELPANALKIGVNIITVDYVQNYSHQGQGLHKFVDPETKEVFLYSQFETFDANRFMPCFDQPDLRATLTMTVEAPAAWQVITTSRESNIKNVTGGRKLWTFPATTPLATYLFSLHAGPFQVWHDKFEDIPLRLFARPSLAKHVLVKEWFLLTKQGLKFFNNYFNYKYPFKKYDQLVVPDFNAGAMENVAAVTFSERFVHRSEPTRAQRRDLAGVLLHEMAHMWFGDIVTMKWWNNLWLNESFATFMASLSLNQATEFNESWQEFFAHDKTWAYWEDGLVTTHPIEAPVNTVKDAFATFDGITYGKGASVLKQLWAYMTPEQFKKGLQVYIAKFAFQNADLKDFIDTLQAQTDRDLSVWAERWLRQSGADKLSAKWSCQDGKLQSMELISTPKKEATFRPQTVQLALFNEKDGKLDKPTVLHAVLTQSPYRVMIDATCPTFVYPNYQDDAYAEVSLDPVSLVYAKKNLLKLREPLLRTMVWHDLWQMVRDTEMPLKEYIAIINDHFAQESDEIALEKIAGTVSSTRGRASIVRYWPQDTAQEKADRLNFISKVEDQYMQRFLKAKASSDQQKFWFDSYVDLAVTPKALQQLAKWSKQSEVGSGFKLDLDRRWSLVRQLARYQHADAAGLLVDMKKTDTSERGQKGMLAAEAIQPNMDVKQKWVSIVKQPKPSISFPDARVVLGALFPIEQQSMAQHFANDYYEYLKVNGASENEIFVTTVARGMAPLSCEEKASVRMHEFLKGAKGFAPTVTKTLRVNLQEDERCQRIRAASSL